jgi:hypothetical protein
MKFRKSSTCEGEMFLTSKNIPELQRLINEPGGIAKIKGKDISLSVAMFLAVTHRALWLAGKREAAAEIARLGLPGVASAIKCLTETTPTASAKPFGATTFDLYRIASKGDILSANWDMFRHRFRRSGDAGRNGKMFDSISSVLGEMGDNVVWHAFEADNKPCPAIAGFHVANGNMTFCVADAGQGFLRSLQRVPKWEGLKNDYQALDAVITNHATSRPDETEGTGFKLLITSMLDYNGMMALRSGKAAFQMTNKGALGEGRNVDAHLLAVNVPGSSVTAVFAERGDPAEQPLE